MASPSDGEILEQLESLTLSVQAMHADLVWYQSIQSMVLCFSFGFFVFFAFVQFKNQRNFW